MRRGLVIVIMLAAEEACGQCYWEVCGYWYSEDYTCTIPAPPQEVFAIEQTGDHIVCTKIIGDECVPAPNVSWEGTCEAFMIFGSFNVTYGLGMPIFPLPATLEILSENEIVAYSPLTVYFHRATPLQLEAWSVDVSAFPLSCTSCEEPFPNVFTPNGDGINDLFTVLGHCPLTPHLFSIRDRWGRTVYEMQDALPKWDGRIRWDNCPEGVYYWSLLEGTEQRVQHGTVHLLR